MLTPGFHEVPAGHVAAVVTHLEMSALPEGHGRLQMPEGVALSAQSAPRADWYRDLFLRIGAPWLWWSRLEWSDARLAAHLAQGNVRVWSVEKNGVHEGLLELDFSDDGSCELAFFGLTDQLIGTGTGRALMSVALDEAFARPITKLVIHTCTLDSPQALQFYRKAGFVPVRQEIEIAPDPRLAGLLPRAAGAHVPLFEV
ncbi:GNAT family N-acetyltransferase [Roseobacteraceae bacterium S113]